MIGYILLFITYTNEEEFKGIEFNEKNRFKPGEGDIKIINCKFTDYTTGVIIDIQNPINLEIEDCIFKENQGIEGCINLGNVKSVKIKNTKFINNKGTKNGIIVNSIDSNVNFIGCTFDGNEPGDNGCFLYLKNYAGIIDNCIFIDNSYESFAVISIEGNYNNEKIILSNLKFSCPKGKSKNNIFHLKKTGELEFSKITFENFWCNVHDIFNFEEISAKICFNQISLKDISTNSIFGLSKISNTILNFLNCDFRDCSMNIFRILQDVSIEDINFQKCFFNSFAIFDVYICKKFSLIETQLDKFEIIGRSLMSCQIKSLIIENCTCYGFEQGDIHYIKSDGFDITIRNNSFQQISLEIENINCNKFIFVNNQINIFNLNIEAQHVELENISSYSDKNSLIFSSSSFFAKNMSLFDGNFKISIPKLNAKYMIGNSQFNCKFEIALDKQIKQDGNSFEFLIKNSSFSKSFVFTGTKGEIITNSFFVVEKSNFNSCYSNDENVLLFPFSNIKISNSYFLDTPILISKAKKAEFFKCSFSQKKHFVPNTLRFIDSEEVDLYFQECCFNFYRKNNYHILVESTAKIKFGPKNCIYGNKKVFLKAQNDEYNGEWDCNECHVPNIIIKRNFIRYTVIALVVLGNLTIALIFGYNYLRKRYCSDEGEIFSNDFEKNTSPEGNSINIGEMTQENPLFTATETFGTQEDVFQHDFDEESNGFL